MAARRYAGSAGERAADLRMERESCAKLVEVMIDQIPWKDQRWSRAALVMAARAIRRGRHLTAEEKMENLKRALADDAPPLAFPDFYRPDKD